MLVVAMLVVAMLVVAMLVVAMLSVPPPLENLIIKAIKG
jgi:hypothetical protein